jgi:hypothetical protein
VVSSTSLNKGNYIELIHLAGYDERSANHFSTATTFKGTSNQIQYDLINSVTAVMFEEIKCEIAIAPFVAILLDETIDIAISLNFPQWFNTW